MDLADALARIDRHQEAIRTQIRHARASLEAGPDDAGAARVEMVRLLIAYQLFKHGQIFDPAIRSGSAAQMRDARALKTSCVAATEAYRAHVHRWGGADEGVRWAEYRLDVGAMMRGIERHLVVERDDIVRLLAPGAAAEAA